MTDKEINRANLNAFLVRCIGHGSAVALDAEFGLRVLEVSHTYSGNVRIALDGGHVVIVNASEHLMPTRGGPTEAHPDAPYCKPDQSCCDFCCGN